MKVNSNTNWKKLIVSVVIKYLSSILIVSCILFIPAWTINYWNGWVLMAIMFIPMLLVMIYLIIKDPELVEKRIKTGEKEKEQQTFRKIGTICLLVEFIIPGFDYRFQWSAVPLWLVALSSVVFLLGYFMFFMVMKQNTYASRVVEIQDNQKIIDTGLYSVVRHPMYTAIILVYCSAALVLGSYFALIQSLAWPLIFAFRIRNEEKVMMNGLEGYSDYTKKVKYRIVPFIW